MPPDPRPPERVRDPALLRDLHHAWRHCVLCFYASHGIPDAPARLSLHHIHKHPRDDVAANLVMLCGSGTTGHHGLVEAHDPDACAALVRFIRYFRPDVFEYLSIKLRGAVHADDYLRRLQTVTDL